MPPRSPRSLCGSRDPSPGRARRPAARVAPHRRGDGVFDRGRKGRRSCGSCVRSPTAAASTRSLRTPSGSSMRVAAAELPVFGSNEQRPKLGQLRRARASPAAAGLRRGGVQPRASSPGSFSSSFRRIAISVSERRQRGAVRLLAAKFLRFLREADQDVFDPAADVVPSSWCWAWSCCRDRADRAPRHRRAARFSGRAAERSRAAPAKILVRCHASVLLESEPLAERLDLGLHVASRAARRFLTSSRRSAVSFAKRSSSRANLRS